jgi:undecaprenyl-diphosphatase
MSLLHALILGIVEGITEFLPISSTAHLILAVHGLRIAESEFVKSFEIIIQLGAILSVVVLYWSKFWNWEVLKKLVVAVIPTGIIGLTVYKAIKGYLLGNVTVVLLALVIGGIVLILFERSRATSGDQGDVDFSQITYKRAFLIGLFQAIAVIPGVSRSAATIVGGSLIGVSKRTIVEFSFMLAVPTMLAASGLELLKGREALAGNYPALAVGFVVSFITAFLAI